MYAVVNAENPVIRSFDIKRKIINLVPAFVKEAHRVWRPFKAIMFLSVLAIVITIALEIWFFSQTKIVFFVIFLGWNLVSRVSQSFTFCSTLKNLKNQKMFSRFVEKKLFKRFPKTITAESLENFRNLKPNVDLKLAP